MKVKVILFFMLCTILFAQEKNKLSVDEKSGKPMLLGICDRTSFADSNFAWWFDSEYNNYEPDLTEMNSLKDKCSNIDITIVLGTWCSDSRREVPRFYKILDKLNYDQKNLTLISVDRKKSSPTGDVDKLSIKLVPTFIFYKNGKEIGRIVETPEKNLEEDFLSIVSK